MLVIALIANYVFHWETFSRIWISFLFYVGTSSYERRAQFITLEIWNGKVLCSYIFENCDNLWMKRDEVFLFHQGRSQDFDWAREVGKTGAHRILAGQGRLTKREHKLLWGPHNGVRVEKTLKTAFENVSKINYIALVSGHLKDIGYNLNPKYWKVRA